MGSLSSRRRPARRGVAGRLAATRAGAARRSVIVGLVACIGERVRPASPALDSWARDRWELQRLAHLQRQLDEVRERWRGH